MSSAKAGKYAECSNCGFCLQLWVIQLRFRVKCNYWIHKRWEQSVYAQRYTVFNYLYKQSHSWYLHIIVQCIHPLWYQRLQSLVSGCTHGHDPLLHATLLSLPPYFLSLFSCQRQWKTKLPPKNSFKKGRLVNVEKQN